MLISRENEKNFVLELTALVSLFQKHISLLSLSHPSPSPPALTECGAAQASKGPVGEGSQGGEACGTPKGICGRKGGRSEHWAAGSEQASWTGKEAGQQAGPGKVLRFNVQCVV